MKVLIFGATGMIGQGVLRECLRDPDVEQVLCLGRQPTGSTHGKLRELIHRDFLDLSPLEADLAGFDACFFCLGVSSAGMGEADYRRITLDLTLHAAGLLSRLNPDMSFSYVSGAGSGQGKAMWARVKGETEHALLRLPFKAVHLFRPGFIQPLHGIRSRTPLYRLVYAVAAPLTPLLRRLAPRSITTTEQLGRAMLAVARNGYPTPILEARDITRF
jgi:uncharacterized protein YbjT (DUF2867 family)